MLLFLLTVFNILFLVSEAYTKLYVPLKQLVTVTAVLVFLE